MTAKAARTFLIGAASLVLTLSSPCPASQAQAGAPGNTPTLQAGAARVETTPTPDEMPAPFKTVADPLYVRALVLDEGPARVVLVIADVPTFSAGVAADLTRRIADAAHVPADHVLLGASHTHNAIRVDTAVKGISLPGSPRFVDHVIHSTMQAVAGALANLQPARMGYGTGSAALVANRNAWLPAQHRFIDGIDRTGNEPIDRRLGVLKVETLAGEPLAFLLNYAIEPVVGIALESEIGGDVPGATARYLENRTHGKAVALFTVGAAGSPLYRARRANDPDDLDPRTMIQAMSVILGEEALSTARDLPMASSGIRFAAAHRTLQCPGKITTPQNLPSQCAYTPDSKLPACVFTDREAPPVTLNLGLLRLGDLAVVDVDANVTPALWRKLSGASPLAETMLVALTYGPLHYVVDDAAYPLNTYEATASTARQGCAEEGFIADALSMIEATN